MHPHKFHNGGPDAWRRDREVGPERHRRSSQPIIEPRDILTIVRDENLRLKDRPDLIHLAERLMWKPNQPLLQRFFQQGVLEQADKRHLAGDPFWASYPPKGSMPRGPEFVPFLAMPTGDVLTVRVDALTHHLLIIGPTGSGKTVWIRLMLEALLCSNV